ncbi:MAG TPA: glucosamine-6-phosphate isomerase [Armatimonadetes bacterium]|nr:glucosamine-6-phosphate isomerase [Armatimonadota bacterium]
MAMTLEEMLAVPTEDLPKHAKVKVKVFPDLDSLYQDFARTIADEIKEHNARGEPTRIILPVGPTPHYPILARISNEERISWKNVYTFNMDEYLDWQGRPVPVDHPMSFEGYMRRNLFDLLDPEIRIPEDHIHFPHPFRIDEISERIQEVGGIDTCYGGIGYHGHVAFNEPMISRWYKVSIEEFKNSLTRVVFLADDTFVINSVCGAGGNSQAIPPLAVTIGMKDILASRRIRLYCDGGNWQKTIFRIALMGEPSVEYPVTLLQDHPDVMICADTETASPVATAPK